MNELLRFHHLGLAVKHPDKAAAFLAALGYACGETVHDPEQNANLRYCRAGQGAPDVELIFRTATPGPLEAVLRDADERIYHTCWQTPDLDAALARLRLAGRVLAVSAPRPAVLFGGRRVGFYHLAGAGLVELLEGTGTAEENAA